MPGTGPPRTSRPSRSATPNPRGKPPGGRGPIAARTRDESSRGPHSAPPRAGCGTVPAGVRSAAGGRGAACGERPVGPEGRTRQTGELVEPRLSLIEQLAELGAGEGGTLSGPLDLDQAAAAEADDVQV